MKKKTYCLKVKIPKSEKSHNNAWHWNLLFKSICTINLKFTFFVSFCFVYKMRPTTVRSMSCFRKLCHVTTKREFRPPSIAYGLLAVFAKPVISGKCKKARWFVLFFYIQSRRVLNACSPLKETSSFSWSPIASRRFSHACKADHWKQCLSLHAELNSSEC